ncbi:GGDEF domain-containing protein [Lacimicrobium sp. SS2-24]|uniref:GGDEF domain-containing protein n=1 Tax=Lacimicrobium sp. SS2-24 TaxID=2005569 RepID=UPI000B4BAD07|nr:GGDEF domain-containing protein [Lacimicrobium sp. SS2-24]
MQQPYRTAEEWVVMTISLLGAVSISPFMAIRVMQGDWLIALLDAVAIFAMLTIFFFVRVRRQTSLMSHVLALVCALALLGTIELRGSEQVFWAYPAVLAVFFLLRPWLALPYVVVTLLLIFPVLLDDMPLTRLAGFYLTISATVGFTFVFALRMRQQQQMLLQLATTDALTGAGNRRALEEQLLEAVAQYRRAPLSMSLILLDLDNFKNFNDKYGHEEGDVILQKVTDIIRQRIRRTDKVFRFGGEEFVILACNTGLQEAGNLAEALRKEVACANISRETVTISLGVAEYQGNETGFEWLGHADKAMYQAKASGRNSLCLYQ